MKEDKKIFLGSPVHNKSWCIEEYLRCIEALEYPKELISLVFFLNDAIDGTKDILLSELKRLKETYTYNRVEVYEENFGYYDERHRCVRSGTSTGFNLINADFSHFALVRNKHKNFLQDEDYFFSIDCDVLIKPKVLNMLLATDRAFVGIPINNQENRTNYENEVWPRSNYNIAIKTRKGYVLWKNFPWDDIFEVDLTGACVLIHRDIATSYDYHAHQFGEDAGFCGFIKANGLRIWMDTHRTYEGENVLSDHAMNKLPTVNINGVNN